MEMELYIVTCEGVYRHEILGIFDNEESAWKEAEERAKNDVDDYHNYDVSKCVLNNACEDVDRIGYTNKGKSERIMGDHA